MKYLKGIYLNRFAVYFFFFPFLLAILLYLCFRIKTVLFFEYTLGVGSYFALFQEQILPIKSSIPKFCIDSIPGALWAFSVNNLLCYTAKTRESGYKKFLWYFTSGTIIIGFELAQYFGLAPGTFDSIDLITTILAISLSTLLVRST